jgi:hypothetical protein
VKYWELIADNLSKAGWSWGCVSAIDSNGRTIWIADAHCGDGQHFIVHADETLTAFLELESAIRAWGELPRQAGEIFSKLGVVKPMLNQAEDHFHAGSSPLPELQLAESTRRRTGKEILVL